jgi:hypothetical protein
VEKEMLIIGCFEGLTHIYSLKNEKAEIFLKEI